MLGGRVGAAEWQERLAAGRTFPSMCLHLVLCLPLCTSTCFQLLPDFSYQHSTLGAVLLAFIPPICVALTRENQLLLRIRLSTFLPCLQRACGQRSVRHHTGQLGRAAASAGACDGPAGQR